MLWFIYGIKNMFKSSISFFQMKTWFIVLNKLKHVVREKESSSHPFRLSFRFNFVNKSFVLKFIHANYFDYFSFLWFSIIVSSSFLSKSAIAFIDRIDLWLLLLFLIKALICICIFITQLRFLLFISFFLLLCF